MTNREQDKKETPHPVGFVRELAKRRVQFGAGAAQYAVGRMGQNRTGRVMHVNATAHRSSAYLLRTFAFRNIPDRQSAYPARREIGYGLRSATRYGRPQSKGKVEGVDVREQPREKIEPGPPERLRVC